MLHLLAASTHRALDTWRHLVHPQAQPADGTALGHHARPWARTEWSATQWSDTESSFASPEDQGWADTVADPTQPR